MSADRNVFVVDDDDAVRRSIRALLESDGLTTRGFESAQAFLDGFSAEDSGCLVVDVQMPGMSGLELQNHLTRQGIDLPIIIITGHGDVPMAVQALKAGAFDFIEKPLDDEIFLDSVWRALERSEALEQEKSFVAEALAHIALLTPREHEVLEQLVTGRPNKVIAYELGISTRTVEAHRSRVMEKMQSRSLSHLVRMAIAAGIEPQSG
ncbi:MAG: response regulator [Alphaproteobacteria bacterium]|nr:response regulator [Alphaproteobacteria bacterium]